MCNCKKNNSIPKKTVVPTTTSNVLSSQSRQNIKRSVLQNSRMNQPEPEIENLSGDTFEDKMLAFADLLGIKSALPENVLIAAMDNPTYARNLLNNRGNTNQLYDLINNPPQTATNNHSFSNTELISKAGKALLKWGFAGFATVSEETLKRREDACLGCKNLVAPTRMLQRFSASSIISNEIGKRTGNKTCSACGCVVKNKMRLATDTCPVENPDSPGLNLWGEIIKK